MTIDDHGLGTASRRKLLAATAFVATIPGALASTSAAAQSGAGAASASGSRAGNGTHAVTAKDGTRLFVKDWGRGRPVVFSHGWPLTADAWDAQMMFLASNGFRVVAHDRRGHGRSDQPWTGNDMEHYADDFAAVMDALDLRNATLVGHSTGGGEVARYVGRHGTGRIAQMVLIGAVPPLMVKTDANPGGVPKSVFDGIRAGVLADRSQFYRDLAIPFFGYNRPNAKTSDGVVQSFWRQGMLGSINGQYDCIREFSEVDYTDDLKKIDKPTLVLHGDDDQIVPIANSGELSAKIVRGATLKVIPGGAHGMCVVQADLINRTLLEFLKT